MHDSNDKPLWFKFLTGLWVIASVVANAAAGSAVVSWGDPGAGGDHTVVEQDLRAGVISVMTTERAMAALKEDGSVVVWGDPEFGGTAGEAGPMLSEGVTRIFAGPTAFAALKTNGAVVSWGSSASTISASAAPNLASDVVDIVANRYAFAGLKADGSVVTWGNENYGGNSNSVAAQLANGVTKIVAMDGDFVALKSDGSVIVWGSSYLPPSVVESWSSRVIDIVANKTNFAAIKVDGSVAYGPNGTPANLVPHFASGVERIVAAPEAMTVFKVGGEIVCWSTSNSSYLGTRMLPGTIAKIVTSTNRFTAMMTDGTAVTWGANVNSWTSPEVGALNEGVVDIFGHPSAFEATKADGSVVAWGAAGTGKVSAAELSFVKDFGNTGAAGCALKSDGTVEAWGLAAYGGETYGVMRELESSVATKLFGNALAFAVLIETPRVYVDSPDFMENLMLSEMDHKLSVPMGLAGEAFTFSLVDGDGDDANPMFSTHDGILLPQSSLDYETMPVTSVRVRAAGDLGTTLETVLHLRILNDTADDTAPTYGVVAFGNLLQGGDASQIAKDLKFGVEDLHATWGAFAAVKKNGDVLVWGQGDGGGTQAQVPNAVSNGIRKFITLPYEMTVLTPYGQVLTWGNSTSIPQTYHVAMPDLRYGIVDLIENGSAYVAMAGDGRIFTWGHPDNGATTTAVDSALSVGCVKVLPLTGGFIALTNAGEVVGWGVSTSISPNGIAALRSGISNIEPMGDGFIATKTDGSKLVRGTGIDAIINALPAARAAKLTKFGTAWALLLTDGSVVGYGTMAPAGLESGVKDLVGNSSAVAALKADGSVVVWGDAASGGNAGEVDLSGGVVELVAGSLCFAALKEDGSVVSWGLAAEGGDSSVAAAELGSGVLKLVPVVGGFIAVKSNGRIAIWGQVRNKIDFAVIEQSLQGRTVDVVAAKTAFAALVREPPPEIDWVAEPLLELLPGGQETGRFSVYGRVPGETYAFSLTEGTGDGENSLFRIYQNRLITRRTLDHESVPIARVRVRMEGSSGSVSEKAILLRIDNDYSDEILTGHRVVSWGLSHAGGNSEEVAADLLSGVAEVMSADGGFVARKLDGSVIGWGNRASTAGIAGIESGARRLFGTAYGSWAALKEDGMLISWGNVTYGGGRSCTDVVDVTANDTTFAALRTDGSVVDWGRDDDTATVAHRLRSGVVKIFSNVYSFAALKWDGSVVTWGGYGDGGYVGPNSWKLEEGVIEIFATDSSFAALKNDGSVVTWGQSDSGGNSAGVASSLASGVVKIFSTKKAYAALKSDGSVVTWGHSSWGGDQGAASSQLRSQVAKIISNSQSFAAVKTNGSVVTWGNASFGGSTGSAAASLTSGVVNVSATLGAFAALKSNGAVVTWGYANGGGSTAGVANQLAGGVLAVAGAESAFAAVKSDGKVVTWGISQWGGDSSQVAGSLYNVAKVVPAGLAFAAMIPDAVISPGMVAVVENAPANTVVAAFVAKGGKPGEIFAFSLASGQTDEVMNSFRISGNQLLLKRPLDFEETPEIELRVIALGNAGTMVSSAISVKVIDQTADNWSVWLDRAELSGVSREAAADPDGDGLSNLFEFVTGRNPMVRDANNGAILLGWADGYQRIEFFRNSAARHLNPRLQFSETMDSWLTAVDGEEDIEIETIADEAAGGERVVVWIPESKSGNCFVRLIANDVD